MRKFRRRCLTKKRIWLFCVGISVSLFLFGHLIVDGLLNNEHVQMRRLKANTEPEQDLAVLAQNDHIAKPADIPNNIIIESIITPKKSARTPRPTDSIPSENSANQSQGHPADQHGNNVINPKSILPSKKYIIYYCDGSRVCGGWGDRQVGMLSTFLWAECTNREFGIIMPAPCPLENFLIPNKVNWLVNRTEVKWNYKHRSSKYISALNDQQFRQTFATANFEAKFPQDILIVRLNYNFIHSFKKNPLARTCLKKAPSRKGYDIFAHMYKGLFKLTPDIQSRMDSIMAEAKPTRRHKLVCAHVRLGRNPTIPFDSKIFNTVEFADAIWKFMSQYKNDKYVRYFFTSDSEELQRKANELFSDRLIQIPGKIIHIDHIKKTQKSALCDGFEKVILDQDLLTRCDVLVISDSVFSRNAATIRGKEDGLYLFNNGTVSKTLLSELFAHLFPDVKKEVIPSSS